MTLPSYPIPNLINGVSQQAITQRRDTQVAQQSNGLNYPVDGNTGRPGSKHVAFLAGRSWEDGFFQDVVRDSGEKYRIVVHADEDDPLRVFDLGTGEERIVVTTANARDYIRTAPTASAEALRSITVEDYTFILNTGMVVRMDEEQRSPPRYPEALIYVRATDYAERYTVILDGQTWWVETETNKTNANQTTGETEETDKKRIRTDVVAEALYQRMTDGLQDSSLGLMESHFGLENIRNLGFQIALNGNVFRIWRNDFVDFTISTVDGNGGEHLIAVKDRVGALDDLPKKSFEGFVVQVKGESAENSSGFYLRYEDGLWQESPAPDIAIELDAETMPHALLAMADGTFTFGTIDWGARVCGDGVDTAKDPSFVGRRIIDMSFSRNRLGMMTDGGKVWSKAGQFFTFFPDTIQTILSTAPIDVTVAHTQIALLRHSVAFNEQVLLFADGTQFNVGSGEVFEEKSVSIKPTTAFNYSPKCRPVGSGNNVYFVNEEGGFSMVYEFYVVSQGQNKVAQAITAQCPRYVPRNVRLIAAASGLSMLALLSADTPSTLWVYNSFTSGEEKLQSSWSRWDFPPSYNILHAAFDKSDLNLAIQRSEGVFFERIDCSAGRAVGTVGPVLRLDGQIDESLLANITYDSGHDRTTFVLPWAMDPAITVLLAEDSTAHDDLKAAHVFPLVEYAHPAVTVSGDIRGEKIALGVVPEARTELSTFWPKDRTGSFHFERVQCQALMLAFTGTSAFRVEVTHDNGKVYKYWVPGRYPLGPPKTLINNEPNTGVIRIPVQAENTRVKVTLINDAPGPSAWQSVEWLYRVTARGRRTAGG